MYTLLVIGTMLVGAETQPVATQYVNWRELKLPCSFATKGGAPITGLRLWWTDNGGNSWQALPATGTMSLAPFVNFTAPADGNYGFVLQAVDSVGNASEQPGPGTSPHVQVVVDTEQPQLDAVSPEEQGAGFASGQVIRIAWDARDANLGESPVTIGVIAEGSDVALPVGNEKGVYPARGEFFWPVPLSEGSLSFVFSVRDRAGNAREVRRGPFPVKSVRLAGETREVITDKLSKHRETPVFFRFEGLDPKEMGAAELYCFAIDGGPESAAWQRAGVDAEAASPIVFQAPRDGLFALTVAIKKKKKGEEYLRPPRDRRDPDVVILVDTHDPQVRIASVNKAQDGAVWLDAGTCVEIALVVDEKNLKDRSAAIEYSLDQGQTWQALAEGLDATNGTPYVHPWNVPHISCEQFLLRARAEDAVGRVGTGTFAGRVAIRDTGERAEFDARKLVQRGRILLSRDKPAELNDAVTAFRTAVGFLPNDHEAHFLLGQALCRTGNRAEGLTHLREAVRLYGDELKYRLELVQQLLRAAEDEPDERIVKEIKLHLNAVSFDGIYASGADLQQLKTQRASAQEALKKIERELLEKQN